MPLNGVIVIGGGLAGLSCAVALAEAGVRIRLFEKRPYLGGRATSYLLPGGEHVDNCQHVTLGCCPNLADFYRRVGADSKIRFYDRLLFMDGVGRRGVIEASTLPAPFHLSPSFALFPALSWSDKRGIARAMLSIARNGGRATARGDGSMLHWLRGEQQTEAAMERFWRVVLVSALNEELPRIDARYGVDVFWKAFLMNRGGYEVGIPSVPLAELYAGCRQAIESRGGEVRTRAGVAGLRVVEDRVQGILLDDGHEPAGDAVVVAVPHEALPKLLPESIASREPALANLHRLGVSPITGVHLWFDRTVLNDPFLTLLEHTVQWIFNKTQLYSRSNTRVRGREDGQYLQLVISASYQLVTMSREEIVRQCLAELRQVLPAARDAQVRKATVIKETAATFSPAPGCDRWRPSQTTAVPGLYLAGDWTQTGWPATMEGAVRSGYLAAEAILAAAGKPRNVLQAELPADGLARRWARE